MAASLLLSLILTGCAGTGVKQRLVVTATEQGKLEAKKSSLRLADECYLKTPHAKLSAGKESVVIIDEERIQTTRADASKFRCVKQATDVVEATK